MRAIVPVAGPGTRLRPHTHTAPKVLLHVAGKPILGHILDELVAFDIGQITFIVGYLGERVRAYVESEYPQLKADYVEQTELLGLGHAIWLARNTVTDPNEPVLIILGDTIFQADLRPVLRSDVSMIGVKEVGDPRRFGIVELEGGDIRRLTEKPREPKSNLAIVGIYYLAHAGALFAALDEIVARDQRTAGELQLTDALQLMLDRGERMRHFAVEGWHDCGKPETLLHTNRVLLECKHADAARQYAQRFPDSIINAPVYIAPTALVENSIVGPYVTVADGCSIRNSVVSNSILSSYATVEDLVLTESIVSDRAKIKGNAYRLNVGDSSEVTFGSFGERNNAAP